MPLDGFATQNFAVTEQKSNQFRVKWKESVYNSNCWTIKKMANDDQLVFWWMSLVNGIQSSIQHTRCRALIPEHFILLTCIHSHWFFSVLFAWNSAPSSKHSWFVWTKFLFVRRRYSNSRWPVIKDIHNTSNKTRSRPIFFEQTETKSLNWSRIERKRIEKRDSFNISIYYISSVKMHTSDLTAIRPQ